MNGGASPCRRRSRCSACSFRTCAGAAGEGTGQTGGGQSSMSTEKGSSPASAWGLSPETTALELPLY